jgi:crotonobetainyl-CoA:carnitine CoA-transferase CaiB-like acyl-CoA transferase
MSMPLEGIRVLDMTIWQQGPVATQMLADMGAEVIKIEEPVRGDPGRGLVWRSDQSVLNTYFECHNRNKKGITLDVRKQQGREALYRLVEKSDVFVENLRPGVMERLELDYPNLSRINPRIIYASGTGWGSRGPDARKASFDVLAQGRGGMLSVSGEPDEPPALIQVNGAADWVGAATLAYGIMVALFNRERNGIGQEVEVSLLGSQASMGQLGFQRYLFSGKAPRRMSRKSVGNPLWNTYQAGDGDWLVIAALQSQRFWPEFCKVIGIGELENDARFNSIESRRDNSTELVDILDRVFAAKSRSEWIQRLEGVDIPCAPVNSYADLFNDPQMMANDYIVDFDHPTAGPVKLVGIPVRLSKTPGEIRSGAPEFGQHTEEVLLDIGGYSWEEIARLKAEEVI